MSTLPVPSAKPVMAEGCREKCRRYLIVSHRHRRLCGPDSMDGVPTFRTQECESAPQPEDAPASCTCEFTPPWIFPQVPPVEIPTCVAYCERSKKLFAKYIKFCSVGPSEKEYASPRCDALEEQVYSFSAREQEACGCQFPSAGRSEWVESLDD